MSECPFKSVACGLSVPCKRCRAASSMRNNSVKHVGHQKLRRSNSYWIGKSGR